MRLTQAWCSSASRLARAISFRSLGGLLLIAGPADRGQAIGIVRVLLVGPQGEGRAVIKDKEAQDQPRAAVGAAPLLAQHDLRPKPARESEPGAPVKGGLA